MSDLLFVGYCLNGKATSRFLNREVQKTRNMKKLRSWTPKSLLLLDGIGAVISASFLIGVLPACIDFFGLERRIYMILGSLPVLFALFSFGSYFFSRDNHSVLLKIISIANLSYCALTIAILAANWTLVTMGSLVYFTVEIIIVVTLSIVEFRIAKENIWL